MRPTLAFFGATFAAALSLLPVAASAQSLVEGFSTEQSVASGVLEVTGVDPLFDAGVVKFQGTERGYLRTAQNYKDISFIAEVTMTVSSPGYTNGSGWAIGFFGFGVGAPGSVLFDEPISDASAFVRVMPTNFNPGIEFTNGFAMQERNDGVGDGKRRIRVAWNALTQRISYAVQENYTGGAFVPTYESAQFALPGIASLDNTNSRIFFGGAGEATFDDLSILAFDCNTRLPRGLGGHFKTLASAARALHYQSVEAMLKSFNKACRSDNDNDEDDHHGEGGANDHH